MRNNMDRLLQRPVFPKYSEPNYISTQIMTNGNSDQSGWTKYLDVSVDRRSEDCFEIERRKMKRLKYKHDAERYPTFQGSSITCKEEDSSIDSDASSGPQHLSLPLRDVESVQEQQIAGSFFSVTRERSDIEDRQEDLESVASCSTADVNPRKTKFREVDGHEHVLLLQDTASSSVHSLEDRGIFESEAIIEQNLQLPVEILGDIEVNECEWLDGLENIPSSLARFFWLC